MSCFELLSNFLGGSRADFRHYDFSGFSGRFELFVTFFGILRLVSNFFKLLYTFWAIFS